ncbi:UvrD-helicase domain-containing protein [Peterkaempfera bronchialis]|uniref:UvrD-helicase domain-containing protein n=1 Tax=Peterkaempfera bronchialis TaxID=2126346 RepID=UPI003C2D7692
MLDEYQRAVADHPGGPLLVLAGPGTGKTTTLVEAVAGRIARGTDPERILVLTFSRKAAVELRDRMAARLGGAGGAAPQATTFHSFCYALVRAHQDPDLFADPLRLLSGPEQDVLVRELLAGDAEDARRGEGRIAWPDDLRACLTTRGFADEVRAVLARSRELAIDPAELRRFAARDGRPDWAAAAHFYAEYLDVLDMQGVLDYAELVHRAVLLAERPEVAAALRGRYQVVFVDEYQDTDPSQVRLLRAMAGDGRDLVAVGDPDQSIYAFRGADINGILDFPTDFPRADGTPAEVKVLRVSRRAGEVLLAASRQVARRMPVGRLPAAALAAHRSPRPDREGGRVEVLTYPTPGAELDGIADLLRRAHLEEGVPWGGMAVLVRAGGRSIPGIRRALTAAGVPLETDGDDIPLRDEPAVAPLLLALRVAALSAAHPHPPWATPTPAPAESDPAGAEGAGAEMVGSVEGGSGAAGAEVAGSGASRPEPVGSGASRPEPVGSGEAESEAALGAADQSTAHPHPTWATPTPTPAPAESDPAGAEEAGAEVAGSEDAWSGASRPEPVGSGEAEPEAALGAADQSTAHPHPTWATPAPIPAPAGAEGAGAEMVGSVEAASGPAAPQSTGLEAGADGSERVGFSGAVAEADPLTAEVAHTLLTGPLGGMDGSDLRRLGRALREEERAALRERGGGAPTAVRPAAELIREALAEPERLVALDPAYARRPRELGMLLRKVREMLAGGAPAEEALWALWENSGRWQERLERAARRGGPAGRNADRDLDALCALFETAARAEDRVGHRGALNFLEELDAQDIAADTLAVRAVRPDAVRLMTAHRAKGLEWPLVVVAGVQEGLWPDLRRRGSLLEADRIGRDGLAEPMPPGALLAEERRLFYVAVTRARERLVVTAVKAQAEDGDEPSRFLRELYREEVDRQGRMVRRVPPVRVEDVTHRPRRPLSVPALVAELRATCVDPAASVELRAAAAERLARLAAAGVEDGAPLVPSAHPDRWWGLAEPTAAEAPLRDPDRPVQLTGSAVEQLRDCSLQWFLDREVRARTASSGAQGFGSVLHVLADEVGSGRTPADLEVLMERLDGVWDALAFDAPWKSDQEKREARAALERFLHWHTLERGRTPVATEHPFDVTLKAGGRTVEIRGSMDRVERDAAGLAYVVDFKTGKSVPTAAEVAEHPQLAVYQLAVREGALDGLPGFEGEPALPGGAELVQLRTPQKGTEQPKVQSQQALPPEPWIEQLLAEAAGRVLDERFVPTTGAGCERCAFRGACSARPEGRQTVE